MEVGWLLHNLNQSHKYMKWLFYAYAKIAAKNSLAESWTLKICIYFSTLFTFFLLEEWDNTNEIFEKYKN